MNMFCDSFQLWNLAAFILIWSTHVVPGQTEPSIERSPEDHVVRPGETVTLTCIVRDKTSDYLVAWIQDGRRITRSNNESLDTQHADASRYSLPGNWAEGDYSLRIDDILTRDEGMFKCVIYSQPQSIEVATSNTAMLTIEYAPDTSLLTCSPNDVSELRVGVPQSFSCSSENGNPPVSLSWSMDSEAINSTVQVNTGHTVAFFQKVIGIEDNGKVFRCYLSHELVHPDVFCDVGPLDVIYKPRDVAITTDPASALQPSSGALQAVVDVNDRIVFKCTGDANPAVDFTWTVQEAPGCDQGKHHIPSDGVLHLTKATMAYHGATITCTANNSVGTTSTSVTLVVIGDDPDALCHSTTPKPITTRKVIPVKPTIAETKGENPITTMHIIIIIIAVAFLIIIAILGYIAVSRKRQEPIQLVHVAGGADDTRSISEASIIFHSRHNTPDPERGNSLGRMQSHFSTMSYDTQSIDSATALMHLRSMESPEYKANPKLTGSPTRKLKGGKEFQVHEMDNSPFHRIDASENVYDGSPRRMPPTPTPKSTLTRQPSEHKYEECPMMKKYTTHASQTDLTMTGDMIAEREEISDISDDDSDIDYNPPKENFSLNNCNIRLPRHTEV
ncbi:uncharacterized protein [Diadema antillarum]|uniref:uncharacterized protein n=1 Tax=Diadema antillarum TaxID=105358 RepID=UPI003A8AE258